MEGPTTFSVVECRRYVIDFITAAINGNENIDYLGIFKKESDDNRLPTLARRLQNLLESLGVALTNDTWIKAKRVPQENASIYFFMFWVISLQMQHDFTLTIESILLPTPHEKAYALTKLGNDPQISPKHQDLTTTKTLTTSANVEVYKTTSNNDTGIIFSSSTIVEKLYGSRVSHGSIGDVGTKSLSLLAKYPKETDTAAMVELFNLTIITACRIFLDRDDGSSTGDLTHSMVLAAMAHTILAAFRHSPVSNKTQLCISSASLASIIPIATSLWSHHDNDFQALGIVLLHESINRTSSSCVSTIASHVLPEALSRLRGISTPGCVLLLSRLMQSVMTQAASTSASARFHIHEMMRLWVERIPLMLDLPMIFAFLLSIRPHFLLLNTDHEGEVKIITERTAYLACHIDAMTNCLLSLMSRWNIDIQLHCMAILLDFANICPDGMRHVVSSILPEMLRILIFFEPLNADNISSLVDPSRLPPRFPDYKDIVAANSLAEMASEDKIKALLAGVHRLLYHLHKLQPQYYSVVIEEVRKNVLHV